MALSARKIKIRGQVQGVGFRRAAQLQANELEVTGWSHNLADGRVEIICEGKEKDVNKFIAWNKKGPRFAKVQDVEITYEDVTGEWDEFLTREFGF